MTSSWQSFIVESRGDYREEAPLEALDAPLYKHQQSLPRLPAPTLEDTIDRFFPTALPLAETKEEAASLQKACKEFLESAKPLQNKLLQRQKDLKDSSWLQYWWNSSGYLQLRDPLPVNVSYFFQLRDDPSATTGIQRGAAALRAAANFRNQVCSGNYPQDVLGKHKTPLCSVAYKYMFHACRIPFSKEDTYKIHDPSRSSHCIVACRNQFFCIPLLDDEGNLLSLTTIEQLLVECQNQAKQQDSLELGWFTWCNRNDWAHARQQLLKLKGIKEALTLLESGMLLLCLDEEEPISYRQCASQYFCGGGGNRWFDKSIQLITTKDGKLGFVGEHSMMDGMPAVNLCNYILLQSYAKQKESCHDTTLMPSLDKVVNIFKDACSDMSEKDRAVLMTLIEKAKNDCYKLVDDHSLDVESFQGYGSDWIKSVKFSPDAYVQMVIQLATFRLFGKQVGTYESIQVRPFLHGRTEAARSVSPASHAFLKAMGPRPDIPTPKKLELFRQATTSHVEYIRNAAKGQGVDRHFFGLMMIAEGEELPSLYSHPLFLRSKQWRVSTSTLPNMPGFGPVVEDGVGIAYEIKPRSCMFTVTCKREHGWSGRLCHLLEEALLETRNLVEMQPHSKL